MGTSYQIKLVAPNSAVSSDLPNQINQRLQALNHIFSTYQSDSELMQFNQAAVNEPQNISADMLNVISLAKEIFSLSGGAFDPTVGPLVNLWGFGPEITDSKVPSAEIVDQQRMRIGFDYLSFNAEAETATRKTDIQLDLSAVAKGYAVDAVAELLSSKGFANYLVEIGGELRASGYKENGQPWRIAIEKPSLSRGDVQQAISLENIAIATSGDYRNYFEKDGKRYSHTIDPRTGTPIEHTLASVTVIDSSTAKADALATAMMVMGVNQSLLLAEKHHIPVYLLVKQSGGFDVKYSTAFEVYLSGE